MRLYRGFVWRPKARMLAKAVHRGGVGLCFTGGDEALFFTGHESEKRVGFSFLNWRGGQGPVGSECRSSELTSAWPENRIAGLASGAPRISGPREPDIIAARQTCKELPVKNE